MSTLRSEPTGHDVDSNDRVVYLIDAATAVDTQAANQWIDEQRGGTVTSPTARPTSLTIRHGGLTEFLAQAQREGSDPLFVPLRVSRPQRRILRLLAPPARLRQRPGWRRWLTPGSSDRGVVVVGKPATLAELTDRFHRTGGRSLAAFVGRQASLALDRAERDLIGTEYKFPRFVVEEMTESNRFRVDLAELAASVEQPLPDVEIRVRAILDEMVATENHRAVELWGTLGAYFSRAYNVQADASGLQAIRDLNACYPLVFLPNHRSYLDPLVLRPALLAEGLPLNHVMGGINVGFWPIGPIAKRSGLVLIQRKFSDKIYKWTLRQYMSFLLSKRFNLEWYIEGGRTRTGKLRPPRFGLLTYLFEAMESSDAEDVYLVPTSITYDRLHEVVAMAAESHGAPKQAESFGALIDYIRAQGKIRGTAYLRFGQPISVRQMLEEFPDKRVAVQRSALAVAHAINEVTPVAPGALVSMAMLGAEDRALSTAELWSVVAPLADYIETRGLPIAGGCDLGALDTMTTALRSQMAAGVIRSFDDGPEPLYLLAQDKHLVAAFFRNNAIHFFVMRAFAELALASVALRPEPSVGDDAGADISGTDISETVHARALELRDLLKFEYFFGDREDFQTQLDTELDMIEPNWRTTDSPEKILEVLGGLPVLLAHRVLQAIFEAYQVVADQLLLLAPGEPFDRPSFLQASLGLAQSRRLRQQLQHSEAISNELFDTALQEAANLDLLDVSADAVTNRRRDFAARISFWSEAVRHLRQMALSKLDSIDAREKW